MADTRIRGIPQGYIRQCRPESLCLPRRCPAADPSVRLNKDGYLDLIFCNAQEHLESPPVYVYRDILGNPQCTELPSSGSSNGAVADLNFDGYDDLLLGMEKSGNAGMRNAYIYYGSPEGLSERNLIRVPAHRCTASAIGDFNGDGRHDVASITTTLIRSRRTGTTTGVGVLFSMRPGMVAD